MGIVYSYLVDDYLVQIHAILFTTFVIAIISLTFAQKVK